MDQTLPPFSDITDDFAFIDDWDEKYRYIIDLGRRLPPMAEDLRSERTKVSGCASQVWLSFSSDDGNVSLIGDSDAAIVKGLVAIVIALYNGTSIGDARALNAEDELANLGLKDHITPQRANGLISMLKKIDLELQKLS